MMNRHPYNINSPAIGPQFFGQEALLTSILETLAASSPGAIMIFGPARSGKTSILHQLARCLPEQAYVPVYWGVNDKANLSCQQALQSLAEVIAARVSLTPPDLPAAPNADYFHTHFLPQVYKKIAPQRLVLLLDDIDALDDSPGKTKSLLSYLAKLITREQSPDFVLATGTPFYDLPLVLQKIEPQLRYKEVPYLTFQETWALITEQSKSTPIGFLSKTIDAIWELSAGHPYFVQLICQETFDQAFNERNNEVDPATLEAVLPRILEKSGPELEKLTAGLSEQQLKTLSACAVAFTQANLITPELVNEILHQNGVAAAEFHQTLKELQKRGILYQDEAGDVCFTLPLMAYWIIKRYPLQFTAILPPPPALPQKSNWGIIALVSSAVALFLIALFGFLLFDGGDSPAITTPEVAAVVPPTVTVESVADTSTPVQEPTFTAPALLAVTSTATPGQPASEASSFVPTNTVTLTPTETRLPTLTPSPTETTAPTLTPTPTETPAPTLTPTLVQAPAPSTPTPLPTVPPTPTTVTATGSFTLLQPLSLEKPSFGPTTFEWQWTGPIPTGFGFEVRVWREGEFPAGVHNAVQDNESGRIESLGDNKYRLNADITDAAGVQGRKGEYLWTVALVQISPEYVDLGQQAAPGRLRFETPGGGGGGGSDGGGGGNVGID